MTIPAAIADAINRQRWRDPGVSALKEILKGVPDVPDMTLFTTPELMERVSEMLEKGGYIDDPQFCLVRGEADLSSAHDPRLVFARALFVAGSKVPGDDVFVAVDDATIETGRIVIFDWTRAVPTRWVPIMTVEEFCETLAEHHRQV